MYVNRKTLQGRRSQQLERRILARQAERVQQKSVELYTLARDLAAGRCTLESFRLVLYRLFPTLRPRRAS